MSSKVLGYEVQSIVIDLLLGGFRNMKDIDKVMLQIITKMISGCLPQAVRIHRTTVDHDDDEKVS